MEKTAGAAFDRKPSPGQGKVPPLAADEAEAIPAAQSEWFYRQFARHPCGTGQFF
nr:hypothetical protein [Anaerofilum sp. An201]